METTLKILILEDSPEDAEMIQRLLVKQKMNCEFRLAVDKSSFINALEVFSPQVIISDHALPQFNSSDALAAARQKFPDIPFIMVTGAVSEEFAASIIKQGADDYILKDRMAKLPVAIKTALLQRKALKEIADYKYALDQSSIISITDQKGIIIYSNENFCRISQYTEEELLGRDHRIVNSGYHSKAYIKNMWQTIAQGKIWKGEFKNKSKDGSFYWVDATIIPFLNTEGKPYQYLAIRSNITERKKAEEQLMEREEQLGLFIEHSPASLAMLDNEMRYIAVSRRWVTDYKLDGRELIGKIHYDVFPGIPRRWKDIHQQCLKGAIVKNEEDSFIQADGNTSWLRWEIRPWHKASGEIGGIIIFTEDITQRKMSEKQLIISEEKYRTLVEQAADGIFIADMQGRFITVNPRACNMSQYAEEELKQMTFFDLSIAEDIERNPFHFEEMQQGKAVTTERLMKRKDGTVVDVETTGKILNDGRMLVFVRDITERKEAEEALKESEAKYRNVVENIHEALIIEDREGKLVYANPEFYRMFGYSPDKEQILSMKDYTSAESYDEVLERHNNRLKGMNVAEEFEYKGLRKDGTEIWIEARVSRVMENNEIVYTQSLERDITERKKAEQQREFDSNNLKALINNTDDLMWSIDRDLKLITFNDSFNKTIEFMTGKPLEKEKDILSTHFTEDELKRFKIFYERALSGETFTIIDRFESPVEVWAEMSFYPIRKRDEVIGTACFSRNITERKKAEENLKMLEEKIQEQKIEEQKEVARAIITGQEKERNYIGQELHDNINQILAGTKMYLSSAGKKNKAIKEAVIYPIELIDSSIAEIRLLCQRLVTPFKDIKLDVMIEELLTTLVQNIATKTDFTYAVPEELISDDLKLNIYRIIQEQLNNIVKYAEAKNIYIAIEAKNNNINISIEDDGKGFDVNLKREGIGISNMINRAASFNGSIAIKSKPGKGCKIKIIIPC